MFTTTRARRVVAIAAALALMAALVLMSGCGKEAAEKPATQGGPTALGSLGSARSALSTMAPDAKLLFIQTAQSVSATATPVWAYLFGSPKSDKTFVVYIANGQTMGAQEYGTAGLTDKEWTEVPAVDSLKVDSDDAYEKAVEVGGGDPTAYQMAMVTYKPKADTSTVEPLVWNVWLEGGTEGSASTTITVDAQTGEAAVSK